MSKRLASETDFDDSDHPDKQRAASSSSGTPQVARVADIIERAFESFFGPQTPERRVFNDAQVTHLMNIARVDKTGEVHRKLMITHKKYNDFMKAYPNIDNEIRGFAVYDYEIDTGKGRAYESKRDQLHYLVTSDTANTDEAFWDVRREADRYNVTVVPLGRGQFLVHPNADDADAAWDTALEFVHKYLDPGYKGQKFRAIQKYNGQIIQSVGEYLRALRQ